MITFWLIYEILKNCPEKLDSLHMAYLRIVRLRRQAHEDDGNDEANYNLLLRVSQGKGFKPGRWIQIRVIGLLGCLNLDPYEINSMDSATEQRKANISHYILYVKEAAKKMFFFCGQSTKREKGGKGLSTMEKKNFECFLS